MNIIGEPTEGMLTRSMAAKLTAASASECFLLTFSLRLNLKLSEALKHTGWVNAIQEELNQFYITKFGHLFHSPQGKIAIDSKWVFSKKKDELGTVTRNKARLHGGCEGGAAAAVTVDGGDGDDRDGVAVTCGGVKAAGEDGVEGVVVRGDGIGGACYDDDDAMVVVGGGGCGSRREGGKARGGAW
ncbi:hypothetical protein Tco_1283423 [Tanacetum coccineum]